MGIGRVRSQGNKTNQITLERDGLGHMGKGCVRRHGK